MTNEIHKQYLSHTCAEFLIELYFFNLTLNDVGIPMIYSRKVSSLMRNENALKDYTRSFFL